MTQQERYELRDDVQLNCAAQYARLSKDENTKVGCTIIAKDGTPVSHGYNGTVAGFPDDRIPHSRVPVDMHYFENGVLRTFTSNKYPFMCHAESNALHYADKTKLDGATIYILGFPCVDCAKQIARSGISRVVVKSPENADKESMLANADFHEAKFMFAAKGIELCIDGETIKLELPKQIDKWLVL